MAKLTADGKAVQNLGVADHEVQLGDERAYHRSSQKDETVSPSLATLVPMSSDWGSLGVA